MAARKNDAAPTAEELARPFGAPPDRFIAERDALAKELNAAGRASAARAVKALRKPALPVWAVNQLARRFPDRADALLAAGDAMRAAQARAVAGKGGDELREASAKERELVAELGGAARSILDAAGHKGEEQVQRVRATLHALPTASEEDRERFRSATLDHELEAAAFGMILEAAPPATVRRASPEAEPPPKERPGVSSLDAARKRKHEAELRSAEADAAKARKEREADAKRTLREAQAHARELHHEQQALEKDVERVRKALASAEAAVAAAAADRDRATQDLQLARVRLGTATERAKRADAEVEALKTET